MEASSPPSKMLTPDDGLDDPEYTRLLRSNAFVAVRMAGVSYFERYDKSLSNPMPRYVLDLELRWFNGPNEYAGLLTFAMDRVANGQWVLTMKPIIRNDIVMMFPPETTETQIHMHLNTQAGLFLQKMAGRGLVRRAEGGQVRWELADGMRRGLPVRDIWFRQTMARTSHPSLLGSPEHRTLRDGVGKYVRRKADETT